MSEPVQRTPSLPPPPGWYPADQSGYERWWDGACWTDALRPIQQVLPARQPLTTGLHGPDTSAVAASGGSLTDQRTSTIEITLAWIFAVITLAYMLPWAIAATRGKSNSVAIALVNFLLGWTFVGWVIALVMACTAHKQRMAVVQMVNVPHYYPPAGHG